MVQGVDYRIPMSVKTIDLAAIGDSYFQGVDDKRRNALLEISEAQNNRAQEGHDLALQGAKAEQDFKSLLPFALQIKPYLESGDVGGAQGLVGQRLQEINGRNGDPVHSMELSKDLMSGDTETALNKINTLISTGERLGYLRGSEPDELKVGRFRQITLPDGTMATLDTATNQMTEIAAAPSIDLSILPEEIRDGVAKLPRDQQVKIAEQYATPKAQQDISEKAAQKEKSEQVTNDTKRLVTELINNESGLRSAIGGVDEFFPTFSDSTKDAEAALDDLRNLLTVDNLKLMSGVLSESDIKILASVGANGLSGSDDRVWGSLNRMAQALGVKSNARGEKAEGGNRTRGSYTSSNGITFEVE